MPLVAFQYFSLVQQLVVLSLRKMGGNFSNVTSYFFCLGEGILEFGERRSMSR